MPNKFHIRGEGIILDGFVTNQQYKHLLTFNTASGEVGYFTGSAYGGGGGSFTGYTTIQDEGSGLTQRTTLNFIGNAVSAVDNAGSTRTDVTISTGSSYNTVKQPGGTAVTQRGTIKFVSSGLASVSVADTAGETVVTISATGDGNSGGTVTSIDFSTGLTATAVPITTTGTIRIVDQNLVYGGVGTLDGNGTYRVVHTSITTNSVPVAFWGDLNGSFSGQLFLIDIRAGEFSIASNAGSTDAGLDICYHWIVDRT